MITGSGIGGLLEIEAQHRKLVAKGPGRVSPFLIPKLMINALSGEISMMHGLKGNNFGTASACASAAHAIAMSLRSIQYDESDLVVTGGSEAAITTLGMSGFGNMRALSSRNDEPERASRPFDKDRDGFVMGEGAGIFVLEELEHAKARGAKIYCEVVGAGMTGDAHHITQPAPNAEGAQRSMRIALADGGLSPEDIDYINAHGTSTPINDVNESHAINAVIRRTRQIAGGQQHQEHDRSSPRRVRRRRVPGLRALHRTRRRSSDPESRGAGRRLRSGLRQGRAARTRGSRRSVELTRFRRAQRDPGLQEVHRLTEFEMARPDHAAIRARAEAAGQGQLFNRLEELDATSRDQLFAELESLDWDLLDRLRASLASETCAEPVRLEPVPSIRKGADSEADDRARERGEQLLREGRVAVFVVAGGQGSRLGFEGPKGQYPATAITKKSLFQLFAEKIRAVGDRAGEALPWYVMDQPRQSRADAVLL